MKVKKRSKVFLVLIALVIIIASITLYVIFNPLNSQGDVKLNIFEQRWIEQNKNNIINVYIPNEVPLYSSEGKGIIFSFLKYFEEQTELEFNKAPYTIGDGTEIKDNVFRIVKSNEQLNNQDLLFYNDNYVVVSKESQKLVLLDNLTDNIGVLNEDFDTVSSYLDGNKLTITKVSTINDLSTMLNNNEVKYIIIPKNINLDMIIESNYQIVGSLNDLSSKYVLTLSNNDARLNDIIKKYYEVWVEKYLADDYHSELFSLYTNIKQIDDKSKADFKSKRYVYGYVDNLPYEIIKDGELSGLSGEFINSFKSFAGVEFSFKKYNSVAELNEALSKGKVDIAINYYNLNTANSYVTTDVLVSNYVILSKDPMVVIDTIKSLPKQVLYALKDTKLTNYIKKNGRFELKTVTNVTSLEGKDLILCDYDSYIFYRDRYFKGYAVAYQNIVNENYGYVINKDASNELFYNTLNYYLSTLNLKQYEKTAMSKVSAKTINLDLSLLWLYAILVPIFVVVLLAVFSKRKKIVKMRNDVKLKYIDPLTSLKNRYYLNNNIAKWEANNIYPQAIVVLNINNLKDINDAYGHEGGDQLIKTAANILINNQMEKTDIVRTDGNEFIIYMVGYDESEVVAYVRKLYRILKDLPYEYGASLGYSMIEDDIKTIEDAINEAILDMVTNRETKRNSDI